MTARTNSPAVSRVSILGGHQSDFARNIAKEGLTVADLVRDSVDATLVDAGVEPSQVESIHVGNVFDQLYNGQGHLDAMPASVIDEFRGLPAMRHETACASASMATPTAMPEIESGRDDCVLVLGVTEPGQSWQAFENRDLERDGRIPVNPSGGLIVGGHPVGATTHACCSTPPSRCPARPAATRSRGRPCRDPEHRRQHGDHRVLRRRVGLTISRAPRSPARPQPIR